MRRREFIALLGSAVVWPLTARAQHSGVPVIGFLRSTPAAGFAHLIDALRQGLGESGFVEGQNVAIEYRWADHHHDRLPALAADLVGHQVSVIVGNSVSAQAAMAVTSVTPIVFVAGLDPVRAGLVGSLNRPGGNVTGVVFDVIELTAKRLALLHELVPKAAMIGVLSDPKLPDSDTELRQIEQAARAIGRQILIVKVASEREIDAAFAAFVNAGADAVLVGAGPLSSLSFTNSLHFRPATRCQRAM